MEDWGLWAVVSLPAGIFKPYSGVKTSILFLDKTLIKKTNKILFIKIKNDGFDLGSQRRKIDKNDLPEAFDILEKWNIRDKAKENDRKAKHFFVPVDEIKENGYDLIIIRYKEIVYEEIEYDSPHEIINGKDGEPGIRQLIEERLIILENVENVLYLIDD